MLPRACLFVAIAALLSACGVSGPPGVPPPLFGQTDLPSTVPEPYDRADTVRERGDDFEAVITADPQMDDEFADTLAEEEDDEDGEDGD